MDQGTGIRVFQHPERTIGALLDITDALSYIPTIDCFGAAMAIKDDAIESHRLHAADEAVAVPLRKGTVDDFVDVRPSSFNRFQQAQKAMWQEVQLESIRSRAFQQVSITYRDLFRDQGVGGSNPLSPINHVNEMARAKARAFSYGGASRATATGELAKDQSHECSCGLTTPGASMVALTRAIPPITASAPRMEVSRSATSMPFCKGQQPFLVRRWDE